MIEYPLEPTYWIISSEYGTASGVTMPDQVTSAGPQWTLLLKTTDEAEWLAECEQLGIQRDE